MSPYISVALFAVALGATLIAADLLRERRSRQFVERAIFAEVVALRWQAMTLAAEMARKHRANEPFDARFFAAWPLSHPLIYSATGAASLGRLSPPALNRVGYFYAQLADARERLAQARTVGHFEPTPYRILSCLIRSYYDIEPWVNALRPCHGGMLDDDPDILDANKLLGEFEDTGQEPMAVTYCWVDCAFPKN